MPRPLLVLIAEDNPADAELVLRALRKADFEPAWKRVDTESDFVAGLHSDLDIILSDYVMPQFGGLRALAVLRERGLEIPFIIVSGTIGEDTAVAAMKQGATDYLLKDRLTRLGPAVEHALEQSRLRRERKRAETALRESEERFRQLAESIQDVFWLTDPAKNRMLYVSPAYETIWGRTCAELYASPFTWLDAIHPDDRDRVLHSATTKQTAGTYDEEYRILRPDGSVRWIRDRAFPVANASGQIDRVAGVAKDVTQRKRVEEELRLFRNLVDQSNDTFEVVDPQTGRFLDVNEKGCIDLGYSRAEFLSLQVFDIDPLVKESEWPQVTDSIRAAGTYSREGLHRRKDGSIFPVEFSAKWVRLDRDYIVAVVRDTTARKQADDVLKESERRFREMLENVELIAMTLDKKGVITFCNDCFLKTTGWTREEAIGADWFSSFIPDSPEASRLFLDTIDSGQISPHYENPIRTRDGQLRDIVWNNTILRDASGGILGMASIGEDVTERKLAEDRIREQAAMLDRAHDAIIVRGFRDRRITFWNKGAETLYGWTVAEATGRDIGELICVDPEAPDEIRDRLLTTEEWHGEVRHKTRSGRELVMNTRATLVRDPRGNPQSVLSINTDISGQKDLEARFLRAQRMESIGTLASGVAHDLNNILSPIMMSVSVLRFDLTPQQREEIIETIESSANRGAQIVKQVLTFGRGLEGEKYPLNFSAVVKELIKIVRETFPKNLTIENSFGAGLWAVVGDATQLHQVLLNLCVNARDAMPNGGKLRLQVANIELDANYASMLQDAKPGSYVLLEVTDTGTGIPPDVLERIFDPFFTTKGIGKGTGLGLSTVLGIVKNHGGIINVNTQPGKGTTFQVYLPALPEHDVAPESLLESVPKASGQLVLVVDDEDSVRNAARIALESGGYGVLQASDGAEALAKFAMNSASIAAVLTDIMMPYMDGVAFARALRSLAQALPIIASTGLGEKARIADLKTLNVETILQKPYSAQTLLRTLHEALHPPALPPGKS